MPLKIFPFLFFCSRFGSGGNTHSSIVGQKFVWKDYVITRTFTSQRSCTTISTKYRRISKPSTLLNAPKLLTLTWEIKIELRIHILNSKNKGMFSESRNSLIGSLLRVNFSNHVWCHNTTHRFRLKFEKKNGASCWDQLFSFDLKKWICIQSVSFLFILVANIKR